MENPKVPPVFTVTGYRAWKTIVPEKRAFALAASCVTEIPDIIENIVKARDQDLARTTGVKTLLEELDKYFAKASEVEIFDSFVDLMYSKRSSSDDLSEFVSKYRTRFDTISSQDLNLQSICSMLLLANLSFTPQEMALAKSVLLKEGSIKDLKVEETCRVIKMLFVDSSSRMDSVSTSSSYMVPKTESINFAGHFGKGYGKDSRQWNSYSGGSYGYNSGKSFGGRKGKGKGKRFSNQNSFQQHTDYQGKGRKGANKGSYKGSGWKSVNAVNTSANTSTSTSQVPTSE